MASHGSRRRILQAGNTVLSKILTSFWSADCLFDWILKCLYHIIFQLSKVLNAFFSFQDEVQETLDKTKESCNEEVTKLEEKADEVKAQMSDLKTHLYAKFGNAINLENDE